MTTPDDLDALEAKLFAAARVERAAPGVNERVLAKAVRTATVRPLGVVAPLAAFVALAAGVSALVWAGSRPLAPASIDREAVSSALHRTVRPAEPSSARTAEPVPVATVPASVAPRSNVPRPAPSLSDELALLERARASLAGGSPGTALELLSSYEKTLRGTRLRAEATMLRIEALAAAGRANEAARLAGKFVDENPGSPLADRARTFVKKETSSDPSQSGGTP